MKTWLEGHDRNPFPSAKIKRAKCKNFPYLGKLDAKPMKERCRTDSQKTQGMSEKSIKKFERPRNER